MEGASHPNSCDARRDNDSASLTSMVLPECMWVNHSLIPSVAGVGLTIGTVYSPFNVFSRFGGRE